MENTTQPLSPNLMDYSLPPPKKSFFQNHKTPIIIASGAILILASMSAYLFYSSRDTLVSPATIENFPTVMPPTRTPTPKKPPIIATPTMTPTPTPNPTANWKNYTNTTYGYSIKYPSDWVARDLGSLEDKIPSYIAFNASTATTSARHITISITTRSYQDQLALGASASATIVGGISGTRQSFQDSDGNTSTVITLPRTSNLLVLRAKTAYLSTFNLMLSTLTSTK